MEILNNAQPSALDLLENLETIRAGVNALYLLNYSEQLMPEEDMNRANDYIFTHLFDDIQSAIAQNRQLVDIEKRNAV